METPTPHHNQDPSKQAFYPTHCSPSRVDPSTATYVCLARQAASQPAMGYELLSSTASQPASQPT